ncbi:MAG TPA: chemotaxis protein CheW [Candidatus Ozemobacteraceae bacterium]|nr:chemotaxis protein CheW [Candidatus Ozemobacteraceae bacterium]
MATEKETSKTGSLAGKYLTFQLANEEYGITIMKIREILGIMETTMVPRMPDYVRGVINLRGKVLPVIDLRRKFGLPGVEDTKHTCIIVIDTMQTGIAALVGIIVDTVSEVVQIADADIDRGVTLGSQVDTSFILGMAKVKGDVRILLDIDRILSFAELQHLSGAS